MKSLFPSLRNYRLLGREHNEFVMLPMSGRLLVFFRMRDNVVSPSLQSPAPETVSSITESLSSAVLEA